MNTPAPSVIRASLSSQDGDVFPPSSAHSGPGPVQGLRKAWAVVLPAQWAGKTSCHTEDSGGRPGSEYILDDIRLSHQAKEDQGGPNYVTLCPPTSLPRILVQEHANREEHNREHHDAIPQDWIRGIIILKPHDRNNFQENCDQI